MLPSALWSCRFFIKLATAAALLGAALYAHSQIEVERRFARSLLTVPVVAPAGVPSLTQQSIDTALALYGIEVPANADHPLFDPELHDRGLTSRGAFVDRSHVTIGPAAFSSWGLLGSTLAHEIEVHCQQNFMAIYLLDVVGLDGTGAAERQAYMHELHQAKRFGTSAVDTAMISDTVQFYYPERPTLNQDRPSLRTWLAATLLSGAAKAL